VPEGAPPAIFILGGAPRGAEAELAQHGLIPVLNSLADVAAWATLAQMLGAALPAALHVDTGMSRLGLPANELALIMKEPERLDGIALALVISHLACADEPEHELNGRQLEAFTSARERLPRAPASFANSSGIFLGTAYHFDLARPGVALYGVNPVPGQPNPMRGVVRLAARILQVREIDSNTPVGYGAAYRTRGAARIATVGVGYADGYLRSLSNRAAGVVGGYRVPLVGRVSMDLITFDVTDVPLSLAPPGAMIELMGPEHPVDALAEQAGTIGYEILTSLGNRYARTYLPADV
jgi:alanine racemase